MLVNCRVWLCASVIFGMTLGVNGKIDPKERLCGRQLLNRLKLLCNNCFYTSLLRKRRAVVAKPSIVDDCCLRQSGGCSYNYLMSYCCPEAERENLKKDVE